MNWPSAPTFDGSKKKLGPVRSAHVAEQRGVELADAFAQLGLEGRSRVGREIRQAIKQDLPLALVERLAQRIRARLTGGSGEEQTLFQLMEFTPTTTKHPVTSQNNSIRRGQNVASRPSSYQSQNPQRARNSTRHHWGLVFHCASHRKRSCDQGSGCSKGGLSPRPRP